MTKPLLARTTDRRPERSPYDRAMPRRRFPSPPVATLGQLHRPPGWTWVYCAARGCPHHAALALAPLVIRWGADASSDCLRERARCTRCGHLGATLRHPSWIDSDVKEGGMPT